MMKDENKIIIYQDDNEITRVSKSNSQEILVSSSGGKQTGEERDLSL